MAAAIPIPRAAEPIEQARGFLYFAWGDAQCVAGQVPVIGGGSMLGAPGAHLNDRMQVGRRLRGGEPLIFPESMT